MAVLRLDEPEVDARPARPPRELGVLGRVGRLGLPRPSSSLRLVLVTQLGRRVRLALPALPAQLALLLNGEALPVLLGP